MTSITGFTTITSTAILFGKTTLHMPPSSLILIGIISPCAGIVGSLLWPKLQRRFVWSNLTVIVVLVCLASLLPVYGCLGFLTFFKNGSVKFGGLTTPGEMYGLAVYFVSDTIAFSLGDKNIDVSCWRRVRCMGLSRDMRVHSTRSSFQQGRKLGGMLSFPSPTRYAPHISDTSWFFLIIHGRIALF